MKIKIAKNIAALLVANISLLAEETKLSDINVNTSAFDAQVKSVSSKQLEEEQASDVKDILKSLPSVTVDGNVRYGQKVYVRGLEDKFANITVDGAKLGGQLFHHSGDQTIEASLLKLSSVELGPNSALSGPGVINGSFKYETKDPNDFLAEDEVFGGKVSLGYETAKERKKSTVAVFGKINKKIEFVGIGTISKDGTLTLGNNKKINNKESDLKSGLAKIVIKPNDYNTFKLAYNRYKDGGNRLISGEKIGSEINDEDYNSITRDTVTLKYEYKPDNEYINVKANIYTNKQYMTRESRRGTDRTTSLDYNDPETKYINSSLGYDLQNTSLFGIHKLTYGTDFNHEEQEVESNGQRIYSDSSTKELNFKGGEVDDIGLYIQDEIAFNQLFLTLGARYDNYKLGGIYSGTFNQLSPKMQLKYQASDDLTLRAGYGKIFKGPALGETLAIDSSDTQVANTNPQIGDNYEIGFDYDLTNKLEADDAIIGFNIYKYNVNDYAHTTKNNSLASQGDIEIWGTETMFSYNKDRLGINASHTYTDGKQTNENGIEYDPKTAKIHVFKVGLNYQLTNELKINYNSQFVPSNEWTSYSSRNDTLSTNKRKSYSVHDLNFTLKPKTFKNTTFNFGIENIFDREYVRHTAFGSQLTSTNKAYEIGRNFKFQVSYKF